MYNISSSKCVVCLTNNQNHRMLLEADYGSVRMLDKLEYCFGDVVYDSTYCQICVPCSWELDRSYRFKKMFEASRYRLKNYLSQLQMNRSLQKPSVKNEDYTTEETSKNNYDASKKCLPKSKKIADGNNEMIILSENKAEEVNPSGCGTKEVFIKEELIDLVDEFEQTTEEMEYTEAKKVKQESKIHEETEDRSESSSKDFEENSKSEHSVYVMIKEEVNLKDEVPEFDGDSANIGTKGRNGEVGETNQDRLYRELGIQYVNEETEDLCANLEGTNEDYGFHHADKAKEEEEEEEEEPMYPEPELLYNDETEDTSEDYSYQYSDKTTTKENIETSHEGSVTQYIEEINIDDSDEEQPSLCPTNPQKKPEAIGYTFEPVDQPGVKIINKNRYFCRICQKGFFYKCHLRDHMAAHTGAKPFTCTHCQKQFSNPNTLKIHMAVHNSDKPFTCNECQKEFCSSYSLKRHILVHSGAKPFTCDHCQKQFSRLGNLKQHVTSVHDGAKPFTCNHCHKQFSHSSSVKQHITSVHNGAKPYTCPHCNKNFSHSSNLKQHIACVHNSERPFKCDQCQKHFASNCKLKRHSQLGNCDRGQKYDLLQPLEMLINGNQ